MIGWIILSLWGICWLAAIRPAIRFFNDEMEVAGWPSLLINLGFALFFSAFLAPFLALAWAFNLVVVPRVDAKRFAARLEGVPKGERLEARIRELEAENERLDRLIDA